MARSLLAAALLLACASSAQAECRASAGGQRSIDVTLSALAGVVCIHDVTLYAGASCEGESLHATHLGCSETRQMVVTDDGHLVSLLARRASRRSWEIVRVFRFLEDDRLEVRSVRLDELPGLPEDARRPRLSIDARQLTVEIEPAITVPIERLISLGRVSARRR